MVKVDSARVVAHVTLRKLRMVIRSMVVGSNVKKVAPSERIWTGMPTYTSLGPNLSLNRTARRRGLRAVRSRPASLVR